MECGADFGKPAVMMLGFSARRDEGEIEHVGAGLPGLTKPVKHSELLEAVTSVLRRSSPAPRETRPAVPASSAKKLDILLAEDNPLSQKLAQYVLRKQGHALVVVDNGVAALEAYERQRFDLILMDVRMPRMDGLQATAAIRQREASSGGHIPIIALTANAMVGDRESCLRAGMDDCLIKPIRPSALLAVVARLRKASRRAPRLRDAEKRVLDHAALLQRVDGDRVLLNEMTGVFFRDSGRLMSSAREAIARCDAHGLAGALHTLCGMFRNLSAEAAQAAVMRLQESDLAADPGGAAARFSMLEHEVRLLNARLAGLRSMLRRAGASAQEREEHHGKRAG
jgi:CheY-like chemotaxis protein/HPt (histidine-containing phosphotransfer) domain-containing protein